MTAPAIAARLPAAASWVAFYLAIVLAWTGLAWMAGSAPTAHEVLWPGLDAGGFLARCLASAAAVDLDHLVPMWALMSLGMMLPTTFPTLQRLAALLHGRPRAVHDFLSFCAAYLLIWLGFSVFAAIGQSFLAGWGVVDGAGRTQSGLFAAILFGFAGLYQFSRLKHACLSRCRHPMTFFLAQWREGPGGAFVMGLRHGRDCLGCCWALMLLAFVGGTMNLAWMGLAMLLMLLEKLAGVGRYVTVPLGVILILAAGFALGGALQTM
jgi:predicted metal-binding membrane protein